MVYSSIVAAILVLGGIIGISIVSKAWGTVIGAGITLLLFLLMLYCYRNAISQGIILLQSAMSFLASRPKVYLLPFYVFFLFLLFITFWIITFVCMQYQASANTSRGMDLAK